MPSKALFVIDVQNDFLTGALANPRAVKKVPNIVEKIKCQHLALGPGGTAYCRGAAFPSTAPLPALHSRLQACFRAGPSLRTAPDPLVPLPCDAVAWAQPFPPPWLCPPLPW